MSIIEKLPWYDEYILILEGKRLAQKSIEELENPEKQLQRVIKFYNNIGADYSKNHWIAHVEADISSKNRGEDSYLSQFKREEKFGIVLENVIQKQDDESIRALILYKDDEVYKKLIRKVMFYIGVSKVKKESEFIKKAYDAIYKTYPLEKTSLFSEEGIYYYIYYFQCLQILIKRYKGRVLYNEICEKIKDRCYNAKLMFNRCLTDMYLSEKIQLLLPEIAATEELLNEEIYDEDII